MKWRILSLSEWLLKNSKVIIFDEPTKGIDVETKVEIYRLMSQLAENGVGIIIKLGEKPDCLVGVGFVTNR